MKKWPGMVHLKTIILKTQLSANSTSKLKIAPTTQVKAKINFVIISIQKVCKCCTLDYYYLVTRSSSPRIPRAAELWRVHSSAGHGPEGGPEVWREECVEDRVQAGVAVRQTVSDDLEDDQSAELDVVDAKAFEKQNNLESQIVQLRNQLNIVKT